MTDPYYILSAKMKNLEQKLHYDKLLAECGSENN